MSDIKTCREYAEELTKDWTLQAMRGVLVDGGVTKGDMLNIRRIPNLPNAMIDGIVDAIMDICREKNEETGTT